MNSKKNKVIFTVSFVALILIGLISYRMYANITTNKDRAAKVSQGRKVAVEVAGISRRDIRPMLEFSANLEPLWSADISAKVDGRIDRLYVNEGDLVSSGMIIGVLDTNELAAQLMQADGNLLAAQASLEQAELDLNRTEALARQGALSVQALDTARTKRDLASGQVRSAAGNVALLQARLDNANIIAPRHGIVLKRYLQAGSYAKAGAQIVSVADVSSLLGKATVGELEFSQIVVGSQVKITVAALQNKEFVGSVTRISPTATLPARTFTAEVTIENSDGLLKPGMFGKLFVPGLVHKNALVVPESALVMKGDQKTVYVVTSDNTVQQRLLKVGYVGDGFAEVLEGLKDDEKIVVAGQNKLKDGSTITAADGKEGSKKDGGKKEGSKKDGTKKEGANK